MKSRPLQYLGLLLLVLVSLSVIYLPISARPEAQPFTVSVEVPTSYTSLAPKGTPAPVAIDNALAKEFSEKETLPESPTLSADGKTASIQDKASTRAEAQTRAERIVKAIATTFKGAKLSSASQTAINALPAQPLLALGNSAIYGPQTRDGKVVPAVKLGLDLQGGVNLVLQLRKAMFAYRIASPPTTPAARDTLLGQVRAALAATDTSVGLHDADVLYTPPTKSQPVSNVIEIRTQAQDRAQFDNQTKTLNDILSKITGAGLTLDRKPQFYVPDQDTAQKLGFGGNNYNQELLNRSVEIIRSRVDKLGVSEPLIQAQLPDRVIVQLPGVNDPQKAVDVIGQTAQMKIVLLPADLQSGRDADGNTTFFDSKGNRVSNGQALDLCERESTQTMERLGVLPKGSPPQPIVAGIDVKPSTTAGFASPNVPGVFFELQGAGSSQFAAVTRDIAGKNRFIPIFLDDKCISAPVVQSAITGGSGQISGGFKTINDAKDLALLLNSGALPAPIDVVENRTVSATLGQDALVKAMHAGLLGLVAVAVFMIAFYRIPGVLANCALAVYCVLNLAAFNLMGGTLTLPGIAGFLLALAMSLDTNILVFERLKEEMAIQPTFAAALRAAFARAWTAILDSHVTTLIAATVLFYFGAGPVKGFALTLGIGVLISLFSAISVTRLLMWSASGLGERNRGLFAGKLPDKEAVLAHHS